MATATAPTTAPTSVTAENELTGCVKWFNNKLSYGFITVLSDGEHKGVDIFVHQSHIKTNRECFRTLYTGECVQFVLAESSNDKHPVQAVNVHGFNGQLLHCENPSYRGTRGASGGQGQVRGGRTFGVSRGGFRRGTFNRSSAPHTSNSVNASVSANGNNTSESAVPVVDTASVVSNVANDTADKPSTEVKGRGRGRGRGRSTKQ